MVTFARTSGALYLGRNVDGELSMDMVYAADDFKHYQGTSSVMMGGAKDLCAYRRYALNNEC